MTPKQIYKKFETKVNKNSTNTNIKVPLGVFVTLFNEQKRLWLDEKIKTKEAFNYIDDIQELLETDIKLKLKDNIENKSIYFLPKNFLRRVTSYSLASKEDCKNKKIVNWIIKPKDLDLHLTNSHLEPSFEWEETIGVLNNNLLTIYKKDFDINTVYLTYYREPKDLDIEGWIHEDGTPSVDIEIDLSDINIEKIINRTVFEVSTNYENIQQANITAQKIQKNELI